MYAVVSRWEFDAANAEKVERLGKDMMRTLRSWDGVEDAFNIRAEPGAILSVITYRDEPTYTRLIQDPEGPFTKAAADSGIEDFARWVWSERGAVEAG